MGSEDVEEDVGCGGEKVGGSGRGIYTSRPRQTMEGMSCWDGSDPAPGHEAPLTSWLPAFHHAARLHMVGDLACLTGILTSASAGSTRMRTETASLKTKWLAYAQSAACTSLRRQQPNRLRKDRVDTTPSRCTFMRLRRTRAIQTACWGTPPFCTTRASHLLGSARQFHRLKGCSWGFVENGASSLATDAVQPHNVHVQAMRSGRGGVAAECSMPPAVDTTIDESDRPHGSTPRRSDQCPTDIAQRMSTQQCQSTMRDSR